MPEVAQPELKAEFSKIFDDIDALVGQEAVDVARGRMAAFENRDGIACPFAHDRARNPHRHGLAWSKMAVRAILAKPRYTGRQAWNRQRRDEELLDVDVVALGHVSKMRWNDEDAWIVSEALTHESLVSDEQFRAARTLAASLTSSPTTRPAGW